MKKIGITISESKTQCYINQAYIDYVHEAGMQPILITKRHDIAMMIDMLDGVILPGGIDIDPIHYGDDNYSSYVTDPEKDHFERAIFHNFRNSGKPIFGICRGFQLIVCEYLYFRPILNNSLVFISSIEQHNQVNDQDLDRSICQHFVDFDSNLLYGKPLKKMFKIDSMAVNSMHHQGLMVNTENLINNKIQGFKLAAWTTRGLKTKKERKAVICEAFQILNWKAPILAVQWHPEELKDVNLLNNFFCGNMSKTKTESL